MAANVHVFWHKGLAAIPVASSRQFTADAVYTLQEPYLSGEVIAANTSTATSSTAAPSNAQIVRVQVQAGKKVRIEINAPSTGRTASSSSPLQIGEAFYNVGQNWTISVLEEV